MALPLRIFRCRGAAARVVRYPGRGGCKGPMHMAHAVATPAMSGEASSSLVIGAHFKTAEAAERFTRGREAVVSRPLDSGVWIEPMGARR